MSASLVHAGLVAARVAGHWRGVLIEGPPGAGKSDLALRAIGAGFRLVADDRVWLFASGGRLFGRAPEPILGLIEARGLGLLREAPLFLAPVDLVVACAACAEEIERLPEPRRVDRAGVEAPHLRIHPHEPSAVAKIRRALEALGREGQAAYDAHASFDRSAPGPRKRAGAGALRRS